VRRPAVGLRVELLVHLLVRADHLARVALDPGIKVRGSIQLSRVTRPAV
jgi:hypothetical protein